MRNFSGSAQPRPGETLRNANAIFPTGDKITEAEMNLLASYHNDTSFLAHGKGMYDFSYPKSSAEGEDDCF